MTRTTRLALRLALAASLLPSIVLASPLGDGPGGRRGPGPGPGGHGRPGFLPPPGYLDLSEEQRDAARTIFEDAHAAVEPLHDEMRAVRDELRTALEAASPDPAAVGTLVIRIDALRDQVRATLETAEAAFSALLTEEQRERWEAFRELRGPRGRRGPGGHGGPGFSGPPGDDEPIF